MPISLKNKLLIERVKDLLMQVWFVFTLAALFSYF